MLFLRNDPSAPEALLGEVFAESGFDVGTFDVVSPARPDDPVVDVTFPDATDYDVIVTLGARWAADDDSLPWVGAQMEMLRRALAAGAGVLGVCFGGQLLARALGGTVGRSPQPEIGWHDVHSSDDALVPQGPWFQWHFDRFTVPPDAIGIAGNDRAVQAFQQGRALGLQFHPEVDVDLVERWIAEDTPGDITRLGLSADELRARTAVEARDASRRLRLLVRGFVGLLADDRAHSPQRLG